MHLNSIEPDGVTCEQLKHRSKGRACRVFSRGIPQFTFCDFVTGRFSLSPAVKPLMDMERLDDYANETRRLGRTVGVDRVNRRGPFEIAFSLEHGGWRGLI
jgi:hypothetical protein